MNYPVWQLDAAGGGLLIILMAVLHVFISHFAVGGGLFLVLTERKGLRDGSQAMLAFVQRHAKFFLLLTMVLGGMTGVGIWFTIALLNPAATSKLIHLFVFGWAIEWVFFFVEIVSLFIYAYSFGRMDDRTHMLMGWIYFAAAWMSLFVINGIIDFMLTPGNWLGNGSFWSAFFNPTFWPALLFRTCLALIIAGLFGMVTATWMNDRAVRTSMLRYSGMWLLAPFVALLVAAWWYKAALPPPLAELIFSRMPEIKPLLSSFAALSVLLVLGGLVLAVRLPQAVTRPVALIMLVVGLMHIGAFEFVREAGRRPDIIRGYMYSNSILHGDLAQTRQEGVLARARWVARKQVDAGDPLASGRELFSLLCLSCHSLGGPVNDITPLTAAFSPFGMEAFLSGLGRHNPYMPPFAGNAAEARALALYLTQGLHGREDAGAARTQAASLAPPVAASPPASQGDYLLLAWSSGGGLCLADGNSLISLGLHPFTVMAQLLRRDPVPDLVVRDVTVRASLASAPPMVLQAGNDSVFSLALPSLSRARGELLRLEAVDAAGKVLAHTELILPANRRMGCANCHGGATGDDVSRFSEETARNVLAAHDKFNGTSLVASLRAGAPVACQLCHADSRPPAGGGPVSLSAAVHAFHAAYLGGRGADACRACHTQETVGGCSKDIHVQVGLDCTSCHGSLEQHSAGLLQSEREGRPRAGQLLAQIEQWQGASLAGVAPRRPWLQQPDCLACHQDYQPPEVRSAVNSWVSTGDTPYHRRADDGGNLRCAACHGSAHALYPVERGAAVAANQQPRQYQGNALPLGSNLNCAVCHQYEMSDSLHHPNMERQFRNRP